MSLQISTVLDYILACSKAVKILLGERDLDNEH